MNSTFLQGDRVNDTLKFPQDTWLVLWENRPLWGWKERFIHPYVTMIILWASFKADIFWLPNEILLLLTPNMHAFFNILTNWESFQYAKITLFFNPEEGDFLTTCVTCGSLWVFDFLDSLEIINGSQNPSERNFCRWNPTFGPGQCTMVMGILRCKEHDVEALALKEISQHIFRNLKDRGYLITDFMRKRDLAPLPVLSLIICYR